MTGFEPIIAKNVQKINFKFTMISIFTTLIKINITIIWYIHNDLGSAHSHQYCWLQTNSHHLFLLGIRVPGPLSRAGFVFVISHSFHLFWKVIYFERSCIAKRISRWNLICSSFVQFSRIQLHKPKWMDSKFVWNQPISLSLVSFWFWNKDFNLYPT